MYSGSRAFWKNSAKAYRYAVRACNTYGCSAYRYSATFTIELPPAVPTGLTGPGSVVLGLYQVSWNPASGATRYELQERSTSDYTWDTIQNNGNRSITLARSGPLQYLYRVRACKTQACSAWSGIISVYVSADKF